MRDNIFLVMVCFSFLANQILAQTDLNFYNLLWEDVDVVIERLEKDSFVVVERLQNEDSYDVMLDLDDLSVKLFCYNPMRDSIMEIMIIAKDESLYENLIANNVRFDLGEYALRHELVLGYDADVYTNDRDVEIAFIPLSYFKLFMISICDSPSFDWRKTMFEEGGEYKYVEADDPKFHYRNFASVTLKNQHTFEEQMTQEFGEFAFDENQEFSKEFHRIKESGQYKDFINYIDEVILTDKKYSKAFKANGKKLQKSFMLEENKYLDLNELESDIFRIYCKNDWIYTFVMLDYLCQRILN